MPVAGLGLAIAVVGCGNAAGLFNPAFVNTLVGGQVPVTPGPGAAFVLVRCVNETGVPVERKIDSPEFTSDIVTRNVPWLSLRWADAEISPLEDRFETIQPEKIQSLGETLSLMLIKLVRETDF